MRLARACTGRCCAPRRSGVRDRHRKRQAGALQRLRAGWWSGWIRSRSTACRTRAHSSLLRELWLAPLLPAGLLLLALSALLLRLPRLLIGGIPALALAALVLCRLLLPAARLRLASYVFAIGAAAVAALVVLVLLRRLPHLWPSNDRRAYNWLLALFAVAGCACLYADDQERRHGLLCVPALADDRRRCEIWERLSRLARSANSRRACHPQTATGYYVNYFSIGPALLWSPLYGAAHAITRVIPEG